MKIRILLPVLLLAATSLYGGSPVPEARLGKRLAAVFPTLDQSKTQTVLVYFRDKQNQGSLTPSQLLSPRAIQRRLKVRQPSTLIDDADFPVTPAYVSRVGSIVTSVRHTLKWFNALSVEATPAQIELVRSLPYVREIEFVGKWKVDRNLEAPQPAKEITSPVTNATNTLSYGASFTQLDQMHVPAVHDMGIYGQGVIVCVMDNGFRLPTHHAFDSMKILAQYDFVDHKPSTIPLNTSTGFGSHGINTLSTVGGYYPGQLIGPAFKASFLLARTENDSSETPVEEDNWAKAVEWADSIGVDVTSTSLGYNAYDAPYTSWTWQDMDGNTTLITRAADRAAGLGIVVVNSAGNSGQTTHNTLGAPADGDSVITAGAVNSSGTIASFSSCGPTFDGRIKPDICAMGVSVYVASSTNVNGFNTASGTSFSCPLSAGVAALILCSHPSLTPMQVRDAMRNTASKAGSPDNVYGWGILDAKAAVDYFGATFSISGSVFADLNGNGTRQASEPVSEGISVHLAGPVTKDALTDHTGRYLFDSLLAGTYTVTTSAGGMLVTSAQESVSVAVDTTHRIGSGITFGLFAAGSISGSLYNDKNGNGASDPGDSGLVGWKVYLSGPKADTVLTNLTGAYTFSNLGPGLYTVTEELPEGWTRSTPIAASYQTTITSGLNAGPFVYGNTYLPTNSVLLLAAWNMVALPQKVNSAIAVSEIFPTALSPAYSFQTGYHVLDSLRNGIGFWIKLDSNRVVGHTGLDRLTDTIHLRAGWNMIGGLSYPVAINSIEQLPDSVVSSKFYSYDSGYSEASSLTPWKAYWVKAKADGELYLSVPPGTSMKTGIRFKK